MASRLLKQHKVIARMTTEPRINSGDLFAMGQIRLSELSVYNWGSFHGLHSARIDPEGTLVTGDNGSGKSTFIDALMALLLPAGKATFNVAAAQDSLRNHLENMYLRLVIDERCGVVFIANAHYDEDDDEGESVRLISRRTLTLYDTLLILVLRKYYQDRETKGEHKIVIDIETIEAGLSPFLPLTNSTRLDSKPLRASLKRMIEKRILRTVRGSDDRFEISPLIRYVVSAEFLQNLLNEYRRLADGQSTAETAQSDSTDDD